MIYTIGQSKDRPKTFEEELKTTSLLLVGVFINALDVRKKGETSFNDFSQTNMKCIFFTTVKEKSSFIDKTSVIYLETTEGSSDIGLVYLRMFRHIAQHYARKFRWFMLSESSFFINTDQCNFLLNLDSSKEFLFLPEAGTDFRAGDNDEHVELPQSTRGNNGSIWERRGQANITYELSESSEFEGYNSSSDDTRKSNRTEIENPTPFREEKRYYILHMDIVQLLQPGMIMSKSLVHKLSARTEDCFKSRDRDIRDCFQKRSNTSWLTKDTDRSSKERILTPGSCRSEDKDLLTRTVTADLSKDLECMNRLHVQLLSKKSRVLNKDCKTLREKLKKVRGSISSTVQEKLEEIREASFKGSLKKVNTGHMFTLRKNYITNSKLSWSLRHHEYNGVMRTIRKVMDIISNAHHEDIKFRALYYGYMFKQPDTGLQYAFKIFANKERHIARARQKFGALQSRVLAPLRKIPRTVNIVVPLAGRLRNFQQFMINLKQNILSKQEPISILVIYFPQSNSSTQHKEIFDNYNMTYRGCTFNWLELPGRFARARALQAAVEYYGENKLLFFADVDLSFTTDFLQRCRHNTVAKQQVYFPVMFKLFNPKIVGSYSSDHFQSFERNMGDWALHSYGPVCAYRDDVMSIGGFNVRIKEWGYEDVQFFEAFISRKYDVIRAADPGLLHLYHAHTKCDVIKQKIQRWMCTGAMLNGLASQEKLVKYLESKNYLKFTPM